MEILAVLAVGFVLYALISLKASGSPATPPFARPRATGTASAQLRQDMNALIFTDRGFLFRRRRWFVGTGCPPVRLAESYFVQLSATQSQAPAGVVSAYGRTWWWFEGAFYWDSAGYSPHDVFAPIRDRQRKDKARLDRAHLMLNVEQQQTSRRQPIPLEVKRIVFERDGGRCAQCGSNFDIQYDHVIPFSLGGSSTPANLQLLCGSCNRAKGANL